MGQNQRMQCDESADERSVEGKELGQLPAPELNKCSRMDRGTEGWHVFHNSCTESKTENGLDAPRLTPRALFGCAQFLNNVKLA
jgi:hypothetical protein